MDGRKKTKRALRGANFTNGERNLLIKITNGFKNTIDNKKTDGATCKEKERCWIAIERKFNCCSTSPEPRSAKQLKSKYEAIKKAVRKTQKSQHRECVKGAGGDYKPPPSPEIEVERILSNTISLNIEGLLSHPFDPDDPLNELDVNVGTDKCDKQDIEVETLEDKANSPSTFQHEDNSDCNIEDNIDNVDETNNWETTSSRLLNSPKHSASKPQSSASKWSNRRRLMLNNKQSMTFASPNFSTLAKQKCELVEIEKAIARQTLAHNKIEHEIRRKILETEYEIKKYQLSELQKQGTTSVTDF